MTLVITLEVCGVTPVITLEVWCDIVITLEVWCDIVITLEVWCDIIITLEVWCDTVRHPPVLHSFKTKSMTISNMQCSVCSCGVVSGSCPLVHRSAPSVLQVHKSTTGGGQVLDGDPSLLLDEACHCLHLLLGDVDELASVVYDSSQP